MHATAPLSSSNTQSRVPAKGMVSPAVDESSHSYHPGSWVILDFVMLTIDTNCDTELGELVVTISL